MEQYIKKHKIWTIVVTKVDDKYLSEVFIGEEKKNFSQTWKYNSIKEIFSEVISCCNNLRSFKQLSPMEL
jgi:hypothetical protein